jgi:hypothetical protein
MAAWMVYTDGLGFDEIIEASKVNWMSAAGRCGDQDFFKEAVEEVGAPCMTRSQSPGSSPLVVLACS